MEDNNTLLVTYSSGIKAKYILDPSDIPVWLECFKTNRNFVFRSGNFVMGINPALVADCKITNRFTEIYQMVEPIRHPIIVETAGGVLNDDSIGSSVVDQNEPELLGRPMSVYLNVFNYKVECKCGAEYEDTLNKRLKLIGPCKKCNEVLFTDAELGLVEGEFGLCWLMTNNRYVNKTSSKEIINNLKEYLINES